MAGIQKNRVKWNLIYSQALKALYETSLEFGTL